MTDHIWGHAPTETREWLARHAEVYLASGGREGHLVDLTHAGGNGYHTHLLLRTYGRKSGKAYIAPLAYGIIANQVTIIASKGGADYHPSWYLNLTAREEVEFQIATQAFRGTWREPEGEEREAVWQQRVATYPPFARYQDSTARRIPIVMMTIREPIPVFSPADPG